LTKRCYAVHTEVHTEVDKEVPFVHTWCSAQRGDHVCTKRCSVCTQRCTKRWHPVHKAVLLAPACLGNPCMPSCVHAFYQGFLHVCICGSACRVRAPKHTTSPPRTRTNTQPRPMSYLRNNEALRKATTWLSFGFVFHKVSLPCPASVTRALACMPLCEESSPPFRLLL